MKLTPYQKDVYAAKICPYCKSKTKIISEKEIYGREYKGRKMIACVNFPKCDSYVGCDDEGIALGRLADKELRNEKKRAHDHFDVIWRNNYMTRSETYAELSEFLNIPSQYTHIGMFNIDTCKKVQAWSKNIMSKFLK